MAKWLVGVLLCLPMVAGAELLRIAVASNFSLVFPELAAGFEEKTGHQVKASYASTGKLASQILHGAPFDVFLAADRQSIQQLASAGKIDDNSVITYAGGILALVGRAHLSSVIDDLNRQEIRLAIANPALAPYGRAALDILEQAGLEPAGRRQLVYGENVSQAWQFYQTGNVAAALVSYAQVVAWQQQEPELAFALIPATEGETLIQQQAGRVTGREAGETAETFLQYLVSPAAREKIRQAGYR